jgi:hypothetical protein
MTRLSQGVKIVKWAVLGREVGTVREASCLAMIGGESVGHGERVCHRLVCEVSCRGGFSVWPHY